jgi:hypothetical protein
MKCSVCHHPRRQDIDHALLAGSLTLSALSQNFGPSLSALWRHKKHLQEKMRQAEKRLEANLRQGYLFKLNQTLAEVEIASAKAQAADNVDQVFKGARVKNRLIRDLSKMEAPWDTHTVYRLVASTQWQSQDCLLPTEPEFLTTGHKILANALFCPCPEPPTDLDDEDDEEDEDNAGDDDIDEAEDWAGDDLPPTSFLETQNSELETPETPPLKTRNLELETLALLQKLFPNLIAAPPTTENRQLATAKPPINQREMSAKLARKTSQTKQNNVENQQDKITKKNTRKKSPVGRESTRRAAYAQAPPAVQPSCSPPANFNQELPPETGNQKPETVLTEHESLFDRMRRKWATTPNASKYSCDSEEFYEEYLEEKIAAGLPDTPPADPEPQSATPPPATENPQLRTQKSELRTCHETPPPQTPKTWEPLDPITHPKEYFFAIEHGYRIENAPKYKPDRRWEEDFGSPRRFKGSY